jgi:hypothetical protein
MVRRFTLIRDSRRQEPPQLIRDQAELASGAGALESLR